MNTYHLVTTPIYETWSNNSINLLAGQWCKIYRDNKIAAKYKYQVADYHWDDRKKFFKDSFYLRSLNSITLSVLTKELNLYHKVKYPERFWKILIGPWLHKFIHIIFDKYQILSYEILINYTNYPKYLVSERNKILVFHEDNLTYIFDKLN
jgi:putative transferase (TIGR04331 family)